MTSKTIPSVKISGVEYNSKNFVCVVKNPLTGQYDVGYNMYFKTIGTQLFDIDSDYDFGSISPIDLVVEMFEDASLSCTGVSRKTL